jgi:UDP-GlcNAc:undecaprenyl-phosphate GlcNAc-1-phosphate transferase
MVMSRRSRLRPVHQTAVRLQGTREWNLLWATLTDAASELALQRMELDVNAPSLREGYHAKWENTRRVADDRLWRFEMPLMAVGHRVGHIRITAERSSSASGSLEGLQGMLHNVEERLTIMLHDAAKPAIVSPLPAVLAGESSRVAPAGSLSR